jgi:hypothetical protein
MRRRPTPLADGLTSWLRGEDSLDAEAASTLVAEWLARSLAKLVAEAEAAAKDVRR